MRISTRTMGHLTDGGRNAPTARHRQPTSAVIQPQIPALPTKPVTTTSDQSRVHPQWTSTTPSAGIIFVLYTPASDPMVDVPTTIRSSFGLSTAFCTSCSPFSCPIRDMLTRLWNSHHTSSGISGLVPSDLSGLSFGSALSIQATRALQKGHGGQGAHCQH